MDSFQVVQAAIDEGKAWHVGITPEASQYIHTVEADAHAMVAHLNSFPGRSHYRVRTQAEVNEAMAKRRGR